MCRNHYEQNRTRQKAYGRWQSRYTESEPARLHVKNLRAAGLGLRRIADMAGVNRNNLQWLVNGRPERGNGPTHQITTVVAERILTVPMPDMIHTAAANHANVDATGTIRRLQALVAHGYPRSHLAERIGWSPSNATRLFDSKTPAVHADTARTVATMFNQLEVTPGPSTRARNEGARRGWPKPAAWDEDTIDDPTTCPYLGRERRLGFSERYLELRELGYTNDLDIARRLGLSQKSFERQLDRYGLRQKAS